LVAFLFETPLAALLAAAGAASVPIVIHLLNRNRYRVVTWAAMRFLLAAQRKNTRRMRLEQFLLLAVRTLLVLLLVLAMASVMPWAEEVWQRLFPDSVALAAPGGRRRHKILVIDGSFSMGLKAGDASCFDRARDLAVRAIQEGGGNDGFSVLLLAAPPRRIVSEPSDDARKVADEVRALRLPHGNGDLAATLNAVEDLLAKSPGKFEEREVYFFTDLQRATWTARQTTDPAATLGRIQARARTVFVDVGQDGANNLAVTNLALGVPLATTGAITPLTAAVHNYGTEPRRQVRIELRVGKAREAAADPPFELKLVSQSAVDVSPGQTATVNFAHKFRTPGEYAVQVRLENDALELDDSRSVVVAVKEAVPVMLVNGKPAVDPQDRATEFLREALNPYHAGLVPRDVPARPKVVTESQFADAGLGDLTPFDCVYLCDVARLGTAEVRRLEAHLRRGGGVVFCLGPNLDLEAYNRLLYHNGEGPLPARLVARQQAPAERYFTLYADEEAYRRPPLSAFVADADKAVLQAVPFYQYVRAELPARGRARKVLTFMPDANPPKTGDGPAARAARAVNLPVGDPAIVEVPRYRGRVVLVTTTVNKDWTLWPTLPSFPPLMQELLHFAVAGRLREQAAAVGDPLEEFLPVGSAGLEALVYPPALSPADKSPAGEATRTQDREEGALLLWTDTDTSGVYRATLGNDPRDHLFAVNVPTATDSQQACESDLTRTNREELRAAYPGWDFQLVTDPRDVVHSSTPSAAGDEKLLAGMGTVVARFLLLAMLVLLLAEVVLAWHFGHYSASPILGGPEKGKADRVLVPFVFLLYAVILLVGLVLLHAAWTGDFLGFLPDRFRAAVEAGLGVAPPAPGEGTHWRLESRPYLWDAASDPWLAGLIALAATALVVATYLREGRTTGKAYKLLLAGLRVCAVLLTLAVLLPQLRLWFERQSWPSLALVLDDSKSMSATDRYQDPQVREAADRLAQVAGLTAPERLQLAQALLTRGRPDWLETLLTRRQVKVHVYHCSGRAARIADVTDGSDPNEKAAAVQKVRDLQAGGETSQLGTAVRQVLNDFRGSSLAAVVMLTDGVTTEGEDLGKVARYAGQVGVPLFFVGVGDAHEVRDLKLHDLQVEESVYVNDRVVFEARLTGHGYGDKSIPVTLKEKGKDKVLDTQTVKLDPEGKPVKVRLSHQPTEPGEKVYVLEVPLQPDEVQPGDNNRLERTVFVRETKLIKILYVEGYARYEFRLVKNLLERESAEDKRNKTMDLKVLLQDADEDYPKQDRSALAEFPAKAELNQFDVVLWGDVDPKGPKVTDRNLQDLADFVRERGGGLLMIAGEHSSPHAYRNTPLQDVLPVEVTGPEPPEVERTEGYRPELTTLGRFHPLFRFDPDEGKNQEVWERLAEMYWYAEGYRPKPAAEVLAVHPRQEAAERAADGATRAGESKLHPLVVQQFVGAGRGMFYGFNETWRWRFREDELRFNQFWIQTVRYLSRSRLGRTELRLDRQTPYRRGEPIKVTVRFPDDSPPPPPETAVHVVVERRPPKAGDEVESQTLPLAKLEGSRATYEALLTQTPEGEYRFWLAAPAVTGSKPRAECRVLAPPGEMDRLRMNREEMERAADETHGRFYTLADADRLLDELPSGSRVALATPQPPQLLWNHAALFALALTLVGTEWFLRKRKHLL
jgi:hypothetical protein